MAKKKADKVVAVPEGTPVQVYRTKDGTPVEPSSIPTKEDGHGWAEPDASLRDDVVESTEYLVE